MAPLQAGAGSRGGVTGRYRLVLVGLLAGAFAIRMVTYALFGGITHPDEVFQYLEQAHRIVFGIGMIPWEYQLGVRSWLFPGFLAGVMEVTRLIGDGPVEQNAAIAVVLSLLSLVPVACGFFWGLRAAGLAGALLAGGLNAVWSDSVLYATHPLMDGVAASCLVGGIYLADRAHRTDVQRDFLLAGLALGLVAVLRIQLLPAIGLTALMFCGRGFRQRWLPLVAGMTGVVLAQGVLDAVTLGSPLQSIWYYVWVNQVSGVASSFGVSPWYEYLTGMRWNWSLALPPLAVCVAAGAWRQARLLAIAASIILLFSLIPHKEQRFIFPAIPLLLTVAGTGSAVLGQRLLAWLRLPLADWLLGVVGVSAWAGLSLLASLHGSMRWAWLEGSGMIAAMHLVSADPNACGLAVVETERGVLTGGYSHLRPGIRLVRFVVPDHAIVALGFDYVITDDLTALGRFGMTRQRCWDNARPGRIPDLPRLCLWHNPVGCPDTAQR
jgi:GPI mannosyltransferase 3